MAVSTQPKLDAQRVRADFPIFEHPIHGKPLAYLDSAASSQKPNCMNVCTGMWSAWLACGAIFA